MRDAIPTICRAEAAMRTFAIRVYQLLTKDDIRNFNASDIAQRFSYPQQVLRSSDLEKRKKMNTTTSLDTSILRRNSLLFWCTLVIPLAIIGIGINFILNPVGASTAYGIPIHDPAAFPFMWVKGIRDIFSGLVVLTFLWKGDRRTTAILFALAIFIPIGDGFVILSHLGFAPPIFIHWGTALYMTIVAAFLLRKKTALAGNS
jgi:hypothetical protein